jgi:DNA-directed RNA polymerase subunit K/omega
MSKPRKAILTKSQKNVNTKKSDNESDSETDITKFKIAPNGDIIGHSDSEISDEEYVSGADDNEVVAEDDSDDEYKTLDKKKKGDKKKLDNDKIDNKADEDDIEVDFDEDDILVQYDDDEDTSTTVIYNKIIPVSQRKTSDYLQKFECGRIIGDYARLLANGAKPYIDITNMTSEYEIAYNSLLQKKIPFSILRKIGKNEYERWNVSELKIHDLPPLSAFIYS